VVLLLSLWRISVGLLALSSRGDGACVAVGLTGLTIGSVTIPTARSAMLSTPPTPAQHERHRNGSGPNSYDAATLDPVVNPNSETSVSPMTLPIVRPSDHTGNASTVTTTFDNAIGRLRSSIKTAAAPPSPIISTPMTASQCQPRTTATER